MKAGDAIHLATADHLKVSEMHTYDEGLYKYKELTDTHFPICRPVATQPIIDFDAHHADEGAMKQQNQTSKKRLSLHPLKFDQALVAPGKDQAGTESKEEPG